MSHELTVTFKDKKGKWIVAPSVFQGEKKPLSEDQVSRLYDQGKVKAIATFDNLQKANAFAQKRSKKGHDKTMSVEDMKAKFLKGKKQ